MSNQSNKESKAIHICKLDEHILHASTDSTMIVVVSDVSIKNQVATLIVHIHSSNKPILKILHHAVNVSTTEAELFAIRCSINQVVQIDDINHIIVVTDSIHAACRIFDSSVHLHQI